MYNIINKFWCILGWHDWEEWKEYKRYNIVYRKIRTCKICGIVENILVSE